MKQLLLLTTLLIMFSSCKQDDDINLGDEILDGVQASFSLVVSDMLPDGNNNTSLLPLTKTDLAATGNEQLVQNLWILQFGANGKLAIKPTYITAIDETKKEVNVVLKNGKEQTVYFVANTFHRTLYSQLPLNTDRTDFYEDAQLNFSLEKIPNVEGTFHKYIPMLGTYPGVGQTGTIDNATFVTDGGEPTKIKMTRLFSKVQFTFKVVDSLNHDNLNKQISYPETPLVARTQIKSLSISEISLINSPTFVNINSTTNLDSPDRIIPTPVISRVILGDGSTQNLSTYTNGTTQVMTFYMLENIAGVTIPFTDGTGGFFNDFELPSDKFGDFNKDGRTDKLETPVDFPSYIRITGIYSIIKGWDSSDPPKPEITKYDAEFRIYLGNFITDHSGPCSDDNHLSLTPSDYKCKYNNYNVNANYFYRINSTISSVNKVDKRVQLVEKIEP